MSRDKVRRGTRVQIQKFTREGLCGCTSRFQLVDSDGEVVYSSPKFGGAGRTDVNEFVEMNGLKLGEALPVKDIDGLEEV